MSHNNRQNDPMERSHVSMNAINILRKKLILGEIRAGDKLVETQLADHLNVSRGPIRNALILLEKEGLVRTLPNGRTEAVGFGPDNIANLYDMRLFLETKAVELACVRPNREIGRLKTVMEKLKSQISEVEQFTELDIEFHFELMAMSGNPYLIYCWQTIRPLLETILVITNMHIRNSEQWDKTSVLDLHEQIIDALAAGNFVDSHSYVRIHLVSSRSVLVNKLKQILNG